MPCVHDVTVESDGEGQKLPAGQAEQLAFDVVVQGDTVYWPETQLVHRLHAVELAAVE